MLQFPSRISLTHLVNRSFRDMWLVAFKISLAWQKYVFGPALVFSLARSRSLPAPATATATAWTVEWSTLRSHASRQKIVHAFRHPPCSAPEQRRRSSSTTSSDRNRRILEPAFVPEVPVFTTRLEP